MSEQRDFATFPHFFRDTIRLYRHTNIIYLNTVVGNTEQFIKRNFRVRLLTNTVLPGAYEYDLALIENDHFLLSSVDLRRLQQMADALSNGLGKSENLVINQVSLPIELWNYWAEIKQLPAYERTPYHRATLHYYMMQIAKYYLNGAASNKHSQQLSDVARFYLREVKRPFRGNREVNEAHLRMDRDTVLDIAARILLLDIPSPRGYSKLPAFLQLREVLLNEQFSLIETLPPEYFFGSHFESEEEYLEWIREYLERCEHIEFWLLIVRSEGILEGLQKMLEDMGRRSRTFSYAISSNHNFTYLLSQRG
jgi:hypothetical protein